MNANERFEYMAEQFCKKTGMLALGKDDAIPRDEEYKFNRAIAWHKFVEEFQSNLFQTHADMCEMLESACNELYGLINEVNKQKLTSVNSQTETPPDLHDMETCHLIQELLKRARGE